MPSDPNEAQLRELYPKADEEHIRSFAERCGELFRRFAITDTPVRLHFFLAQVGHESGGLTATVESMNYSAERLRAVWPKRFPTLAAAQPFARNPEALANNVYGNRMGNGGPESGDGWRYRGRGYIQLTGKDGYRRVGGIAGLNLVDAADLAADPSHALLAACSFWEWKQLNALCDGGDFVKVTRRINGGTNGLGDRRAWLDKVRRVLGEVPETILTAATIIEVQRALQGVGFPDVGAADGVVGRKATAAVTRFRHERGLPPGGIDEALLAALGVAA